MVLKPNTPSSGSPAPNHGLHDLGYKIFLDRYAMKDMKRTTLQVGDTVIVVVNPKTGQREIGHVTAMNLPKVTIALLDGEVVTRDLEHVDKPLETDPRQMMARVARGIAECEATPEAQAEWQANFEWLLDDFKFVPAGRILAAAGTGLELTSYNCYVVPSPTDSRGGIIETLRLMTEIMSRGGGVGINVSSLRPRHAFVAGVNGRSSGAVSWGALYSFVTGLIEQGGCFGPDERIATDKGLIPAAELADRMDAGEQFMAHTHKGLRAIVHRFRNGVKPLYTLTTERGYTVRVTADHKVTTLIDGQMTLMPLRYLAAGDEVLLLLGEGVHGEPVALNGEDGMPSVLDEALASFLGILHAAGENAFVHSAEAVSLASVLFGREADAGLSPAVRAWLEKNGLSTAARVPEAMFRSPSAVQAAFIAAFVTASAEAAHPHRALLADMQQMLAFNGIVSQIEAIERQGAPAEFRLIVEEAALARRVVAAAPVGGAVSEQTAPRTLPDRIRSIEPVGESTVFDFEVEEVHLLSGAGVYTSNSRRGALMLILNDWHPDVFEFINSKREAGKITNANISVGVSDRLMAAVEADGDWDLVFPDTHHPDYDAEWNGDLDTWMGKGYPVVVHRTVKARAVWDAIVESAWASAEPGVFFNERYNKMSNSHYFAPIIATNPCVTGETRLYTDKGLVRVIDLFNDETQIEVTIDGRFGLPNATTPSTRVFRTGRKPVFRLTTREGYSIRATADHRFMTPGGWAELQDLQPGDSVHVLNRKGGFGTQGSLEEGRILGWLTGDGTVKHDKGEVVLSFFGDEKQELAPLFAEYVNAIVEPMTATRRAYPVGVGVVTGRDEARVTSMRLYDALKPTGICDAKLRVPEAVFQGTEAMQRGYLQALFTADGGSQGTVATSLSVRLASSEPELLEQVQMLLSNFGILSRIYRNRRPEMERMMPDGKGGKKAYLTRSQHEIHISQDSVVRFQREIGFLTERKNRLLADRLSAYKVGPRAALFVAQVESITPDGVEDVFDVTEPITHSIVANSLVIHNCGEQGLPGFGVCNLGAINLAKFYDADTHDVAWDQLDRAVRYATRFLDNVIDTTFYFIDENKVQQTGERRVGLNNMGLAELMIRLGIRYGSDESLAFIDRLYGLIARASYETSIELAREKGAFPMFQAEPFLRSGFMQTMPEDIREGVRRYGIRNVTLLTQAPNGTTGTMVNTSTGIEPFFSWVYYRKSRLGLHEEQVPIARDWFEANPGATALPDYFVTAMDLTPEEHVHVQAAIQRWVDSSISKTSNLPNHYTVEQTRAFYEYLYKLGCKGGTVYRDGSRDEQVLMLKGDERAEKEMEAKASAAGETPAPAAAANGHAPVPANGAANGHASAPANGAASSDGAASTGAANGGVLAHEPIRIAPRQPEAVDPAATPHRVYPRPRKLSGTTVSTRTAFGTAYVTMNSDENGCPFEVFITAPGKGGSDLQADAEGLGRMISLQLRTTAPHNRMAMLRLIVEQLQGIGGARAYGLGANRVLSLPDAVARVLADQYLQVPAEQQLDLFTPPEVQVSGPIVGTPTISTPVHGTPVLATPTLAAYTAPVSSSGYASGADVCPSCGTVSLLRVDGCRKCSTCGYSEC